MTKLKILPDYKYQQTCHFCKRKWAEMGKEKVRKCYYFDRASHLDGAFHKYTYRITEVSVPRCEYCEKNEDKSGYIVIVSFLIAFIVGVYLWSGVFQKTEGMGRTWSMILTACAPSLLTAIGISYLIGLIVDPVIEKLYNFRMNCDDYLPIQRLKKIGFVPRDSPPGSKSYNIKENGPLNILLYEETLKEIIEKDNCKITQVNK